MRKLIESTHVSLGGEIGSPEWASPYLDGGHLEYATGLLAGADTLLLGRLTYEGPVAVGRGQHMFEAMETGPAQHLADVTRFAGGVLLLVYTPT
jgi:hypothetical protein